MANVIIPQRFWLRRGTAAALTAANETLYAGEVCCETDTGRAKIGDGLTAWVSLGYAVPGRINLTGLSDGYALLWDAGAEEWVVEAIMVNPMTTAGDLIVGGTAGAPDRIAAGTTVGHVLTSNGAGVAPSYQAPTGGSSTRGITVTGGSIGGSVIDAAQVIGGFSASDYTLTGNWYLWCSPAGSIELDVRAAAFGSIPPNSCNSICGGNEPAVTGAISASGNFTGWSTSIARGDALSVVVNSVTDVTWFVLLLEAV